MYQQYGAHYPQNSSNVPTFRANKQGMTYAAISYYPPRNVYILYGISVNLHWARNPAGRVIRHCHLPLMHTECNISCLMASLKALTDLS